MKVAKTGLALLTPENRTMLQKSWDYKARDLLSRDGTDPKYKGHLIANNKDLQKLIQSSFEGLMSAFAERCYPHPKPIGDYDAEKSSKHLREKIHDEGLYNKYVMSIRNKIDNELLKVDTSADRESDEKKADRRRISKEITGGIITRAIAAFHSVFSAAKYDMIGIEQYALDDDCTYFIMPKGTSRYR